MEHIQAAGYPVRVEDVADIEAVKREHGIPDNVASCHTAMVEGYLLEGHVPADAIDGMSCEIATRSTYWMKASVTANTITQ